MSLRCPRCGAPIDAERARRDAHGEPICIACPSTIVRPLALRPELHALLARVHAAVRPEARCAVGERELSDCERHLGTIVPDPVIALALACGWTLGRLVDRTAELTQFARTTHGPEVASDPRHRLIAFDHWGEWPCFSAGYRPTRDRADERVVVWDWKSWTWFSNHPIRDVASFVEQRLSGIDSDAPLVLPSEASSEAFQPCIEAWPPPPRARFVRHPKLGRGKVVADHGEQLEIDFGAAGIRRVLARFVQAD